jgi:tetratricopeptide (TPR) repeat protein
MNNIRTIILPVLALILVLSALPGCSTASKNTGQSMSLMDRFKAGKPLIGPDEDQSDYKPAKHVAIGDQYLSRKQPELAFDQYTKAAAKDPAFIPARFKRGELLMDKGMHGEALAEFTAVLEHNPQHAPAHEALGRIYLQNKLHPEAKRHLEKAVAIDGGLVQSHVLLGTVLNYMDDYEGAVAQFSRAAELSPRSGYIHNNLGLSLVRLGRPDQAVAAFSRALMLGAPADKTANNLGVTLFKLGRMEEALEAFRCAGDEASAYNNMGYAYFLEGDYVEAMRCFEKAIELRPTFYVRADENLKRARLAAEFAKHNPGAPQEEPLHPTAPARKAAAVGHEAQGIEIAQVMKIYPESPPRLVVKNPDKPIFAVHVSSWRTGEKAASEVRRLGGMGFEARIVEAEIPDKGLWYRVVVGAYNAYDEAMDARNKAVEKIGRDDLRVIRCTAPPDCSGADIRS